MEPRRWGVVGISAVVFVVIAWRVLVRRSGEVTLPGLTSEPVAATPPRTHNGMLDVNLDALEVPFGQHCAVFRNTPYLLHVELDPQPHLHGPWVKLYQG